MRLGLSWAKNLLSDKRLVINIDADLYTSTLYVLTMLAPYLKKDDIIFKHMTNLRCIQNEPGNIRWQLYKAENVTLSQNPYSHFAQSDSASAAPSSSSSASASESSASQSSGSQTMQKK